MFELILRETTLGRGSGRREDEQCECVYGIRAASHAEGRRAARVVRRSAAVRPLRRSGSRPPGMRAASPDGNYARATATTRRPGVIAL